MFFRFAVVSSSLISYFTRINFRVDELRQQCRLAELKQLFSKYLVPSESLSKCLASPIKFDRLIAHLIAQQAIGTDKNRLDDALLAVQLNPVVNKMRVFVIFAYRLIQTAKQEDVRNSLYFLSLCGFFGIHREKSVD